MLEVSVRAMDLRYAQLPVLCGHYARDSIAGAEASIDGYLVDGALRRRHQLGLYAANVGTYTVVLKSPTLEEVQRGTGKGAIVVGLGEYGRLSASDLAETVRAGALAYLVRVLDPVPESMSSVYLLVHPDLRNVPRVRALFDFMVSEIDSFRPLLGHTR